MARARAGGVATPRIEIVRQRFVDRNAERAQLENDFDVEETIVRVELEGDSGERLAGIESKARVVVA